MGVVVDDPLSLQHVDQGLHGEVAFRRVFLSVRLRLGHLLLVFLRFDELLAHEGGGLPSGAGERGAADGVRPVGHLDTP